MKLDRNGDLDRLAHPLKYRDLALLDVGPRDSGVKSRRVEVEFEPVDARGFELLAYSPQVTRLTQFRLAKIGILVALRACSTQYRCCLGRHVPSWETC